MAQKIIITEADLIHQLKLTCQIPTLMEQIATRKIILAAAEEHGITVTTQELQEAADNMRLLNGLNDAQSTWKWLEKNHLSLDDLEEALQSNILANKLAEHLFGEKAEAWFVEHQLDYMRAALYEVIVENEDLAWELFYSLKEKEITFFEVAQKYIQDKELRKVGGYRSLVSRKEMKPEISHLVFSTNSPQLLKPIITSEGCHLVYVDEIIQPQLDNLLRYKICSDMLENWVKDKLEKLDLSKILNAT